MLNNAVDLTVPGNGEKCKYGSERYIMEGYDDSMCMKVAY